MDELIGIYLNPDTTQPDPPAVYLITANDETTITVDTTYGSLTDRAAAGDPYIGGQYFDTLSVINGAAVELSDNIGYTTLDITGGTLQGNNLFQQGSPATENIFTRFAQFIKGVFKTEKTPSQPVVSQQTIRGGTPAQPGGTTLPHRTTERKPRAQPGPTAQAPLSPGLKSTTPIPQEAGLSEPLPEFPETPAASKEAGLSEPLPEFPETPAASKEVREKLTSLINKKETTQPFIRVASLAMHKVPVTSSPITLLPLGEGLGEGVNAIDPQYTYDLSSLVTPLPATPMAKEKRTIRDAVLPKQEEKVCNGVDPQYTYDLNNNVTSMITPFGTWTYAYNAMDRLITITNPGGDVTAFTYDALGRRTSMTQGNGAATTYTYDSNSRLTALSTDQGGTPINGYTYTHNNVGMRVSMMDNDGLHTYQYDDQYRLVNAAHPQTYNPEESYTYDDVGNRLTSHLSTEYTHDNLNRLVEDDHYTYTYDNNGNLLLRCE